MLDHCHFNGVEIARATVGCHALVNIQQLQTKLDTDPFGDTSDLLAQYTTLAPHDGAPLAFQLGRVPSRRPETLRFRLDWEKVATTACRLDDVASLEATLTADYQFPVRCFGERDPQNAHTVRTDFPRPRLKRIETAWL